MPWANTLAWAGESSPAHRAWAVGGEGAAEQGPGGPDRAAGRPGAQAEPPPQPAGGRALLDAPLGPGGPPGVHVGQLGQPLAFQLVDQPP